jgi:hypothetical protein
VTVSIESSSDPDLERRIFSQVHSAGRQLKTISAVIEVMLAALQSDPNFAKADLHRVPSTHSRICSSISCVPSACAIPTSCFSARRLQQIDPATFANVRDRLRIG